MTRIEFDDQGVRIPTIALPPFGADDNLPSTVLTFTENVDFPVEQYRALGFTHAEVWCVGAAGGRGGDGTTGFTYMSERVERPVPQEIWNLQLELAAIEDYYWQLQQRFNDPSLPPAEYNRAYGVVSNAPPYWNNYPWTSPPQIGQYVQQAYGAGQGVGYWPVGLVLTAAQVYEYTHPAHTMSFTTYRYALLYPSAEGLGGGGGGGGMHQVFAVLDDLPDTVPIVVGKAGADSPYAQTKFPYPWTPVPPPYVKSTNVNPYGIRREDINAYLYDYLVTYPLPHTTFDTNPTKGEDGGTSSFGEVGQASGGLGGGPGMIWDGGKFIPQGYGGAGGIGGRLAAGGGAAGSVAEGVNGSDGIWRPETGIGAGGGGGKGGRASEYTGGSGAYGYNPRIEIPHLATAGGQGSYSFADTSVYGQRQFRGPWTYMRPVVGNQVYSNGTYSGTGQVTYVPTTEAASLITPGGGGGARPMKNLKVGSRTPGYSPNGVVVIRLSQIN